MVIYLHFCILKYFWYIYQLNRVDLALHSGNVDLNYLMVQFKKDDEDGLESSLIPELVSPLLLMRKHFSETTKYIGPVWLCCMAVDLAYI